MFFPNSISEVEKFQYKIKSTIIGCQAKLLDTEIFESFIYLHSYFAGTTECKISLLNDMQNAHENAAVRNACKIAVSELKIFCEENFDSNEKIYDKFIKFGHKNFKHLTPIYLNYVNQLERKFRQSGLGLSFNDKIKFTTLNRFVNELESQFELNIVTDKHIIELELEELDGIPQTILSQLEQRDGKFLVTSDYPIINPILSTAKLQETRRKIYAKSTNLCEQNHQILVQIIETKSLIAKLLSFKNFTELQYENLMVKNSTNVENFLDSIYPQIKNSYKEFIDQMMAHFKIDKIAIYDLNYLIANYKSQFAIGDEIISQHFEVENVINKLAYVWESFYNIKIVTTQQKLWASGIYLMEIYQNGSQLIGQLIGQIYLDLFPRDGKFGHACCSSIKKRQTQGDYAQSIILCNFSPKYWTPSEVKTLFHEFGHALHNIFAIVELYSQSGFSTEMDTVEMPSQFAELFAEDASILKLISEPKLSDEVVNNIILINQFMSPNNLMRQLILSYASYYYYSNDKIILSKYFLHKLTVTLQKGISFEDILTERENTFGHLVGYYGAYYSYLWSKVFAEKLFKNIKGKGAGALLDSTNGIPFAKNILEKGGSLPFDEILSAYEQIN